MANLHIALVALLIALVGALFTLALIEASLLHLRRSEVAVAAAAGDRGAALLLRLLDDLPRVMNAVLLAVLLGQVSATSIAGLLAEHWFGGIGITIATVTVTVLLFVYGEAIPKTLAIRQPLEIARRLSVVTYWTSAAMRPFVSVLVFIANAQSPVATDTVTAVSKEELRHLADEAASAGRIEESDAELIERSFTIGDLRADEIMVLRDDIIAVAHDTPSDVTLRTAIAAGHRRIPVFRGDIDGIIGFVRLRDLAGPLGQDVVVEHLAQPALTVGPDISVIALLRAMQESNVHLAVVVDADEQTMGIATIEDAVEELVGTIEDRRF